MVTSVGGDGGDTKMNSIDLHSLIVTLRKYKMGIALATAFATLLTSLLVSVLTPVYRASATILISPPGEKGLVSIEELVAQDLVSNDYFQTQVEILRSRRLARLVVQSLNLVDHWEYNSAVEKPPGYGTNTIGSDFTNRIHADLSTRFPRLFGTEDMVELSADELEDGVVSALLSNVSIRPLKETNLVRIVVDGTDPQLAKRIANGFGESFIDSYLDTKLELTNRASNWLNGKLVGMKEKLEESEAQLLAYKEKYGLIDLGGRVSGINERQIGVLTERLLEAKRERREVSLLLREIDDATARASDTFSGSEVSLQQVGSSPVVSMFSEFESLSEISGNTLVNRHRIAMLEAERKLEELRNRYGEKHPRVIDAKSNLAGTVTNLDRQIRNVVDSVRKRYQLADANARSIEVEMQRQKQEVHTVGRKQIQMVELEREVDANRELYLKFYNRAREAVEAEGMGSANAVVNDPASVPRTPIFPRKRILVLLGLLLSLLASSLIALFIERKRDTVQGVSDIMKRIGLPVLGVVPVLSSRRSKGGRSQPVVPGSFKDRLGAFEESFQTIRSSLYLGHDNARVVVVTSSLPGEGKSTIAANLAYSMSAMERVVLVEADMRRPSIGRVMGCSELGLSNFLGGECQSEDIVARSIGELNFISAGSSPYDPLELLSSDRFANFVRSLRQQYDRVIIDSAPIGAVIDAAVIGKLADLTVFVVKADSTQMDDIEISLDKLSGAGVNVAGAIISQVDVGKIVSYGGHHRYRGYYDQYGYGRQASPKRPGDIRPRLRGEWQASP